MSVTVNFIDQANENPFVDSNFSQSNAGSSLVTSAGYLWQASNNTSNRFLGTASFDKTQSVQATVRSNINSADIYTTDGRIVLYVLWQDTNNHVYFVISQQTTNDLRPRIVRKVAGVDTVTTLATGLADSTFQNGDTLKLDVTWSGTTATFRFLHNGVQIGSDLVVASFALTSGVPGWLSQRNASGRNTGVSSVTLAGFAGPSITSTSDDTPTSGTTLTLNGSNFGTQTGSAGVTVGGVSVTPSSWSATQIQIPITIGANKYGVNVPIVVTDSSGTSSSAYNVQIQPASGVNYVNIAAPLADPDERITATPDIADGDQVEWSNVVGGTISDVTVSSDGSFVAASSVISFDVRVNDGTGWGPVGTQYTAGNRYTYNSRKSKRVII